MEIQQRDNETLAAYAHWFKTEVKRCSFNSDAAAIHIFIKGLWYAHKTAAKIYKKDPQTLLEVTMLVEKFNAAQQVRDSPTSSTVNMMSNDDWCFVCRKTGHIGHHCPDVQCYNYKEFGHFIQDFPDRLPPSGTPHHHNRSCSWPCYDHSHRDRSQSLNYRQSHGRHFHQSWSHHWSHHNISSSNYQRHASHSPSNHHSSLCYPLTG